MKTSMCVVMSLLFLCTLVSASVSPEQAQFVSKKAAEAVWGNLNTLDCTALLKPDRTISAFGAIFGRNDV
ncbi:MAG: hypothetical protein ABH878_05785, partial [bacterium]